MPCWFMTNNCKNNDLKITMRKIFPVGMNRKICNIITSDFSQLSAITFLPDSSVVRLTL